MTLSLRKHLSAPGLIALIYNQFSKIPDPRSFQKSIEIPLIDHLMSGLAVFGLKCPSLLDYDKKRNDDVIGQNLRHLYRVGTPPSDTHLRECLDQVDPGVFRSAFKKLFTAVQRGNELKKFEFLDGHILISVDGTGHFASSKTSCPHCCVKQLRNNTLIYHHQMLGACIVHPDQKNVIPLCPEAIVRSDGADKNDCEQNACKRFLEHFRREHPHLRGVIIEDGLHSTAPHIEEIERHKLKYILGAKPGNHGYLFDQMQSSSDATYHEIETEDGYYHQFKFQNDMPLNKSNKNVKVSFIEYRQTDKTGKEINFSWVTNFHVSKNNVLEITRGGRARWKIENETFNALKNLGYNLEHNYGHGKQYLATNFSLLMMLAFLIDQIQELCCMVFKRCRKFLRTYRDLWELMRGIFRLIHLQSWEDFYAIMLREKILDSS